MIALVPTAPAVSSARTAWVTSVNGWYSANQRRPARVLVGQAAAEERQQQQEHRGVAGGFSSLGLQAERNREPCQSERRQRQQSQHSQPAARKLSRRAQISNGPGQITFSSPGSERLAAARLAVSGRQAARARPAGRWRGRARSSPAAARVTAGVVHPGPRVANRSSRAGSDAIVNWSGWMSSISSQLTGVDTWAPGRARTDQAPNTVLCGAFWLKSTNTRSPRSSFHQAAVIRSGAAAPARGRSRPPPSGPGTDPTRGSGGCRRAGRGSRWSSGSR